MIFTLSSMDQCAFKCTICNKEFSLKRSCVLHEEWHSYMFSCDHGSRKLKTAIELERHLMIHKKGDQSTVISETKDTASDNVSDKKLKLRRKGGKLSTKKLRNEDNNTDLTCNQCSKVLENQTRLADHMAFHDDARPFPCKECSKAFKSISNLRQHMLIHSIAESKHVCDVCLKSFSRGFGLRMHKRTHSGETSYNCDMCDKSFRLSSDLLKHNNSHTRPFQCHLCPKTCTSKVLLKAHIARHTSKKSYNCSNCTKSFSTKFVLKKHIKSKHVAKLK